MNRFSQIAGQDLSAYGVRAFRTLSVNIKAPHYGTPKSHSGSKMWLFPEVFEFCIEKSIFATFARRFSETNFKGANDLQKLVSEQPNPNNQYSPSAVIFLYGTSKNSFQKRQPGNSPNCRQVSIRPVTSN
jgi:hypothetical protein